MTSLSKFPFKKPAAKSKKFKQPDVAAARAQALDETRSYIDEFKKDKDALHAHIDNLEHQAIGYQAVISYLEYQLGKTK